MAQLVLTVAGAVIGGYVGGPAGAQAGAAIGAGLGGAYEMSKKRIEGPRLGDLRVTGTEYGQCIPWLRGNDRWAGQIWWSSDKREVATTEGGKGSGPKVTTFTYEIDVLFGLTDCVIADVSRIWSNGTLVFNRLTGADTATLSATLRQDVWRRMTVYTGAADQLPDPTYEAAIGAGDAPAYRGRGSVFIEGLQLDGSGQLPNLTFEIITAGAVNVVSPTYIIEDGIVLATPDYGVVFLDVPSYYGAGTIAAQDATSYAIALGQWDGFFATTEVLCYEISIFGGEPVSIGSFNAVRARPTSTGSSDVPVIAIESASTTAYDIYDVPDGTRRNYSVGSTMGEAQMRFCRSGDVVIIGSTSAVATKRLYKFDLAGGSPTVTSAVLKEYHAIIVLGEFVYAAAQATNKVDKLDLATLTLQTSITAPYPSSGAIWPLLLTISGELALIGPPPGGGTPRKAYTLNSDDTTWTELAGDFAVGFYQDADLGQSIGTVGSLIVSGKMNTSAGGATYYYDLWTAPITITPATATIQETVEALCARAGMPAGTYDASALSTITRPVRSAPMTQVEGVRGLMEQLMLAYGFYGVLSDKLYFKPKGGAVVKTVAYADLGAGEETAQEDPLPIVMAADLEVPPQIAVQYRNALQDYQVGTEVSDRLVMSTQVATQTIQLGIVLMPDEAKGIADTMAASAMSALATTQISLTLAHADLEPGDAIGVTASDGEVIRVQLGRRSDGGGVLTFDAVREDSTAQTSEELTDDSYDPTSEVGYASIATWQTLDIPLLRDVDDSPGYYVDAKGVTTTFPGAQILGSSNNVDFETLATIGESAVFGTCSTTLGDFVGGSATMDEANVLTVDVGNGELSSSTRDAMLDDRTINVLRVGSEIIRFVTAAAQSTDPNVYKVSRLMRGQLGTESHIGTHEADEACTLLRPQGLRRVTTTASEINQARYIKGVSLGTPASQVRAISFTNTGISQKPYAPAHLRALTDAAGLVTATWSRRTRYAYRWPSTAEVPLGEATEAYEIDLLTGDVLSASAKWNSADKDADVTLSGSDLIASITGPAQGSVRGIQGRDAADDWYFEVTVDTDGRTLVGIGQGSANLAKYPGFDSVGRGYFGFNGQAYISDGGTAYGATWTAGDVIGVRMHEGSLTFYKNSTSQGVAFTGLTGTWYPMWGTDTSNVATRSATIDLGDTITLPTGSRAWGMDENTVVTTLTSDEPTVEVSAAALAATLPVAITPVALVSGVYYGVDIDGNVGSGTVLRRLVAQTAAGVVAQSPYLGQTVVDTVFTATQAYVAAYFLTTGTPAAYSTTAINRFALSDVTTIAATYSAAAGDIQGIAHDGTDLWVLEAATPRLRRLSGTALTVSATHALGGAVGLGLAYSGGDLFFVDSDDIVSLDSVGITENWRTALDTTYGALGGSITGIVVAGGGVFVSTTIGVYVYDEATGTLLATTGLVAANPGGTRQTLFVHGSDVALWAFGRSQPYVILDGATGAVAQSFAATGFGVLGSDGTNIWVGGQSAPSVVGYDLAYGYTPVGASLDGYLLRVYQMSATVGRGYPAEATI